MGGGELRDGGRRPGGGPRVSDFPLPHLASGLSWWVSQGWLASPRERNQQASSWLIATYPEKALIAAWSSFSHVVCMPLVASGQQEILDPGFVRGRFPDMCLLPYKWLGAGEKTVWGDTSSNLGFVNRLLMLCCRSASWKSKCLNPLRSERFSTKILCLPCQYLLLKNL